MSSRPLVGPEPAALDPDRRSALEMGRRAALDRAIVAIADPLLTGAVRHWLAGVNLLLVAALVGGVAAPTLVALGADGAGSAIYAYASALCHQWPFRSFFLFGPQAVYTYDELAARGLDAYRFVGSPQLGWKMAYCERDLAIFAGLLLFGALYAARWRRLGLRPSSYLVYGLLIAPMALDGLTQLPGWRESTWELRLGTGLLFGLASGWLLYPRFESSFERSLAP